MTSINRDSDAPTISLTISKSTPKLRGGRTVVGGCGRNGGCSMFAACIRKSDGTQKIVAADTKQRRNIGWRRKSKSDV